MAMHSAVPPRALSPGDVVAAFSDALGEWSAAQVTDLNSDWKTAGVLDLDWSGAEPKSLHDIGELVPLRLTHHWYTGVLSHCNYGWLLPRTYVVVGNAPLAHDRPSNLYSHGWNVGNQLASQRRWDQHGREAEDPGDVELSCPEFHDLASGMADRPSSAWRVRITDIDTLDCRVLAAAFPRASWLSLEGDLGDLQNASALNELVRLRSLFVSDLFGMSSEDIPLTTALHSLETLCLHSIPSDFAKVARKHWALEVRNGVDVDITGARQPQWVAENRSNPLRDWDGRHHISAARYRKSVAQFNATRRELLSELGQPGASQDAARFRVIGRAYAEAFNKIDGTRSPFIETEEREDLISAVTGVVAEAESDTGRRYTEALQVLHEAIDEARTW